MRRRHLGLVGALPLIAAAAAAGTGCADDFDSGGSGLGGQGSSSGGQSSSSAGVSGAGRSAGTGGAAVGSLDCASVSACGGGVVGTWTVTSSCLELSGDMDISLASLGCATVPVSGALQTTGTFVADADGRFTDNTTTTGSVTFPLDASCLSVSSVAVACADVGSLFTALGWTTATCTDTNGQCSCSLGTEQHGGFGAVVPYTEQAGRYTTSGNTFTVENVPYSYCVSGDTLTVTPQMSGLTGTVVLQRPPPIAGTGGMGAGGASAGGMACASTGGMGGASTGGMGGASTGGMGGTGVGGTGGASTGGMAGAGAGGMGGASASGGSSGAAGGTGTTTGPCDIYATGDTTCVAAHSTIRALFGSYDGNLYEVERASDGTTRDIPVLTAGGFADSAQQDSFCSGTTCTITRIYDQSGHGNFLEAETPESSVGGYQGQTAADASEESLTVGGHEVYSLYLRPRQAYWRDGSNSDMPLGSEPQGIYMVTSGTHYNSGCCFDYGNAQTSRTYEGGPTMDSIYFGNNTTWGTGNGSGPWVMADMEDGMVAQGGSGKNDGLLSQTSTYVTAMEKNNGTTEFALKAADATALPLNTYYQGPLPPGKNPMRKEGAIVLGSGGDCCLNNGNLSEGTLYEGAIVAGYPSDATDAAIHENIVNAGYGQ